MSDVSYLKDPTWLADRELKWKKFKAKWLYDSQEKEIQLNRTYFFEGNVENLIESEDPLLSLYNVIAQSPFQNIEPLLENISKYWAWVLQSPEKRDRWEQIKDLDERFVYAFHAVFSRGDDNLHPNVCTGLFFWLYGEVFEANRVVKLTGNDNSIEIRVNFDINDHCFQLSVGILDYFWSKDKSANKSIFKSFIPYFISIFPHMSPLCFSTKLPAEREFTGEDGVRYKRSWFFNNRWLLTTLNGFITLYEEEAEIDELICNDDEALALFKDGLDKAKMPDEFYRLKSFVLKHKGESLYASED